MNKATSKMSPRQLEQCAKQFLILRSLKQVQADYFYSQTRFNVVPAGRRSGKTDIAKKRLWNKATAVEGPYFVSAPTYQQVKRVYWKDLLHTFAPIIKGNPNKSDLIIPLINDSEIHLIGLDKPERIEGTPWVWGIIDEFADTKAEGWHENIRPALSTPGMNTGADLIGVPEGLNHFYDRAEYAKGPDTDWALHTWHSSIILSPREIEAAQRDLDPRTYRQEYEASFETASGRIYDDYSMDNHTDREFDATRAIHWTHDFNYVPMSSVIIQHDEEKDYCVDEISLESASARNVALEFCERYRGFERIPVFLYGDPSGKAGEKHGLLSNYIEIERILKEKGFNSVERRVLRSERSIRDGQASLRGRILNTLGDRKFLVNPVKCKTLDKGLFTTQRAKGSTYQEDQKNPNHHITTAARFFTEYQYPIYGTTTLRNL